MSKNHPSSVLIKYLFILNQQDIPKYLSENFGIYTDNGYIESICKGLTKFKPTKTNMKNIKKYMDRLNMSFMLEKTTKISLEKIAKDKSKLYFLNTALYRNIEYSFVSDILNSNFSTIEKGLFFTYEDVSIYKQAVFNTDVCSPEDLFELYNKEKKLFDFENHKSLEEIQIESGLIPQLEPFDVMNQIQSITFNMFKKKITSKNSDTQMLALKFSDQARKAASEIVKIKSFGKVDDFYENILLNFDKEKNENDEFKSKDDIDW